MHKLLDHLNKRTIQVNTNEGATEAIKVLEKTQPNRYKHSIAVAFEVIRILEQESWARCFSSEQKAQMVQAAYLHDVGYFEDYAISGFHAYDGMVYLRANDWDDVICRLVLHHSFSRELCFLLPKYTGLYRLYHENPLSEKEHQMMLVLALADFRVNGLGEVVTFSQRLANIEARYGEQHSITAHAKHSIRLLEDEVERFPTYYFK